MEHTEHKPPGGPGGGVPLDSGLACLLMMARLHGVAADGAQLRHEFSGDGAVFGGTEILLAAKFLGLHAKAIRPAPERLERTPLPAVALAKDGGFFILARIEEDKALIHDPAAARPEALAREAFLERWSGELILFTSKASYAGELAKFDFSWFIPAIVKYRRLLGEVLLVSFVLQIIGLATPLFFQVVMDKVLVNHAMKTLNVIAIGLFCAIVFEAVLTGIRSYVFAHTSSKLDVELGARLFRHLLNLPIAYFQARRVGDSVARIRELENIRSFLTGNAVTLVLDLLFSFVFLGVMLWYSPTLTLVVLASIPVYALLSLVFTPMLRTRLNDKFNRGAENQSFLVETLSGMDTVKAMAVEPRWSGKWDRQLAGYVAAGLSVNNVGMVASGGVSLVSKLVTLAIMWLGASLVVEGKLTVGELVAFNMLSGQVSSPILRLAQLWNDFQQVGISMQRLGDILNARSEVAGQKTRIPRIVGAIEFDQVSFRYRPDAPDVIRAVNLKIAPGEVIGIVGRSGSGKSTLTRLAQRLYVPDRGRVLAERAGALIAAMESGRGPRLPDVPGLPEEKWRAAQAHLEGQYRDYRAKLARIEGDIQRFEEALPLATRRARDFEALAKNHDVSSHAWLEKEQARIELAGQLRDAKNQRAALMAETRRAAFDLLTEGRKLADASRQDERRAAEHGKLLRLTAPVDGTVQQLAVHTVGGVVPAAQPLMLVVPRETVVEVEAFLENKDIGFVREGQEAAVKVDAFEYTKYGTVPGRVSHVSRDAIQDEKKGLIYSVKVALDKSSLPVEGRDRPLSAGMSVSVEIKTGERRVIEYVLSPLLQHQRESLHER